MLSVADGVVLSGTGIEPIEVAAGDLDGLRREAQALKRRHPAARTVVLVPSPDVKMNELLQVLAVLQGECSEGEDDPACLFPRASIATRE